MTKLMLTAAFVAMTLVAPLSIAHAEDAAVAVETNIETMVAPAADEAAEVCTETNDAGEEIVVDCATVDAEAEADVDADHSMDADAPATH